MSDTTFVPCRAYGAQSLVRWECFGETRLNQPPADREIRIARWQLQDCVQMIGQDHKGIDSERMAPARCGDSLSQYFDLGSQESFPPVKQVHGEEPTPSGNECAAIVRHGREIAQL
ncbi:hypothetical protein AYJ54_11215 [Bradyrhizobium centrolobii]|uniref:Uncharacterized protein n=1 Tax=Bradyrhizobium centrolobii TaxID=1505087 RepID=A0A176YQ81_9BRAD|nr:hypothetical protein AYJ54_11215 [Bradyrhizobium centrolobii]